GPLFLDHLVKLLLFGRQRFVALREASLEVVEIPLLDRERIELAIEVILALGEALLLLLHLPALDFVFPVEFLLETDLFLAGGNFDFLGASLSFFGGGFADAIRLGLCLANEIFRAEAE